MHTYVVLVSPTRGTVCKQTVRAEFAVATDSVVEFYVENEELVAQFRQDVLIGWYRDEEVNDEQ
jgi:hypothetical protein